VKQGVHKVTAVAHVDVSIVVVLGVKGLGPAGVQDDELHTLDRPFPDARGDGLD